MSESHKPFKIHVSDEKLELLRKKLELATFPNELDGANWDYGAPLSDIKRLTNYWKNKFDWRAQETAINNAFPQYTVDIAVDGFETLNIHYVYRKSAVENAIPLLFVHGWPGSFLEVEKVLPLLTKPASGGPAFHVVAPSLPGYGFSQAPSQKGFGLPQYAEVCHKLMLALGYNEYVTQGGDWGASITRTLGTIYYPKYCKASHINMPRSLPPAFSKNPLLWLHHAIFPYNSREKAGAAHQKWFQEHSTGYFQVQATKPQTLGYSLVDSPVGLLAWIYEKLHDWTDEYPWTEDEILTWISIYLFSRGSTASSLRIYYETMQLGQRSISTDAQKTPLGVSYFPKEVWNPPRDHVHTLGNVVFESAHPKGGHFAAHEQPEALVNDLRKMFGKEGVAFGVVKGFSGYEPDPKVKL